MASKYMIEMIPLTPGYIKEIMHKTGISEKTLLLMLIDNARDMKAGVFTISSNKPWPRTRY
jgi:hypothetical protein